MSVFDSLIDQEHVITILKDAVAASRSDTNESQEMTTPGSSRAHPDPADQMPQLPLLHPWSVPKVDAAPAQIA